MRCSRRDAIGLGAFAPFLCLANKQDYVSALRIGDEAISDGVIDVLYAGESGIWHVWFEPNFLRVRHGGRYAVKMRNNVPDEMRYSMDMALVGKELACHSFDVPELEWSTGKVTDDKAESSNTFDAAVKPGLYLYLCRGGTSAQHRCMSGFFAVEDEAHRYEGKSYRELSETFARERGHLR